MPLRQVIIILCRVGIGIQGLANGAEDAEFGPQGIAFGYAVKGLQVPLCTGVGQGFYGIIQLLVQQYHIVYLVVGKALCCEVG